MLNVSIYFSVRQGTVFLVDFSSGTGYLVHRLRGHEDEVMSLSWCPIPGEAMLKSVNEESSNEGIKKGSIFFCFT